MRPLRAAITVCLLSASTISSAQTSASPDEAGKSVQPFGRGTYVLEQARNIPQLDTQDKYFAGRTHPVFGYRRLISNEWVMGGMANFKIFNRRDTGSELPILTLSHESLRIIRLWHPAYLLAGFKWDLMVPVRETARPISRSNERPKQFGVALTATVQVEIVRGWMGLLRLDRWRGTADSHLHGIEWAAGIGRNIGTY